MTAPENNQMIKGYISKASHLAGTDNAAHISVVGNDNLEYFIIPKGLGIDLNNHLSVEVEVFGHVEVIDDTLHVLVRKYTILDKYGDEWYDDDTAD